MAFDRDAYEVLQVHPKAHQQIIHAAFRVLARLYHPDHDSSAASNRKMAELNDAYDKVRTADRREVYDRARLLRPAASPAMVTPYAQAQAPSAAPRSDGGAELDFGRYQGWTIAQIAAHDREYLRWLSRHTSGVRFRAEIERVLREPGQPSQSGRRR